MYKYAAINCFIHKKEFMSRKHLIYSYKFFDNQVVSTDVTSSSTTVAQLDNASIDFSWSSSTFVGTLQVQVKNGENADWRNLEFSSAITISGTTGSHEIILLLMPFTDLRLFIDRTSGTGTFKAVITSKSVGA